MDAQDNKCPACGATITFSPTDQMWICGYCSSKYSLEQLEQMQSKISVVQEDEQVVEQVLPESTIGDVDVYRCKNCGAEIMADKTTTATFCVYCGSTAILQERILNGRAPDYIIPFKTTKADAINGFKKITKGKLLVPKSFKRSENIEKISGVYIPFWAYDLEANGEVEFEVCDVKTWTSGNYKYKKIDKFLVRKSGHFDFLKVIADASTRFSDDLMDSLEPFDYSELMVYNHAYLSGFFAEKYDINEDEGLERVAERAKNTATSEIQKTVGHDERRIINNGLRVSSRYTHYILLPVWMLKIKYNDKIYTFAMNGQTGKIIGNVPIGLKETIKWGIIFFLILFVIGFIVSWIIL